jgi:hypothetical protein
MKRPALFLILILSRIGAAGAADFDRVQTRLNATLSARVREGRVDYAGLKKDAAGLDAWLAAAASADETDFKGRPREERLAFMINLYNAATLRLILDHYPITSIRKIGPVWDPNKAWKLPVVRIFGRTVTLNTVEHEMIRPVYKDPRVHFALVCAAKSCPPLRSEAYAGPHLNAQLDDQARVFLSQKAKNDASRAGEMAYLSPIFKWYMEDFGGSKKSVLNFVKKWLPVEDSWTVAWTEYDWSLNEDKK